MGRRTKPPDPDGIQWIYQPLAHQLECFQAFNAGFRKMLLVWHRRGGKDLFCCHLAWTRATMPDVPGFRIGTYYHFFPTYGLGKRVLWDGMDHEGRKFMDYIPKDLLFGDPNETELQVTFKHPFEKDKAGSVWQIIGVDKMDKAARGTNVCGIVFSEMQLCDEHVRNVTRPIINANRGWEVYNGTPEGHNYFYKMLQMAQKDENKTRWFVSLRDITQTSYLDGTPLISQKMIDDDRRDGISEDIIQQEYFISFEGYKVGGFFADLISQAYREDRIGTVPVKTDLPVHTVSDLGVSTADELKFSTWFFQVENLGTIRIIDFHDLESGAIPEFVELCMSKGYLYGRHFAPFDVKAHDISTGKDRITTARQLGINFVPIPKVQAIGTRINAGRSILPRCIFNLQTTEAGIIHLQNYRRKYDDKLKEYTKEELHDEHSHAGSAFSYMGMTFAVDGMHQEPQQQAIQSFDPFGYDDYGQAEIDFDPMEDTFLV